MNRVLITGILLLSVPVLASAVVVDFEDLTLSGNSVGPMLSGTELYETVSTTFVSRGVSLPHSFTDWGGGYSSWDGFMYSNITDTTTGDYSNQHSAITGSGFDGSSNYAVAYPGFNPNRLTLPTVSIVDGAYFTNTTYAALDMLNGSDFSRQFGQGDYFKLLITGLDAGGAAVGTVEFLLAEGTNIVDQWTWVDLSALGLVYQLEFGFESSDMGQWGMNTPAYFAMDHLTYAIPEPATLLVMGLGAVLLKMRRPGQR